VYDRSLSLSLSLSCKFLETQTSVLQVSLSRERERESDLSLSVLRVFRETEIYLSCASFFLARLFFFFFSLRNRDLSVLRVFRETEICLDLSLCVSRERDQSRSDLQDRSLFLERLDKPRERSRQISVMISLSVSDLCFSKDLQNRDLRNRERDQDRFDLQDRCLFLERLEKQRERSKQTSVLQVFRETEI